MSKHFVLTHTHRYGHSVYLITHHTEPDMDTLVAWAIAECDYEPHRDDEWLDLTATDVTPFADIEAQVAQLPPRVCTCEHPLEDHDPYSKGCDACPCECFDPANSEEPA